MGKIKNKTNSRLIYYYDFKHLIKYCYAHTHTHRLLSGFICALFTLYMKSWTCSYEILGSVPGVPDIFVNVATHRNAITFPNLLIFRFCGGLDFASRGSFKKYLYDAIKLDYEQMRRASMAPSPEDQAKMVPKTLVLDMSCISHIDVSAAKTCSDVQRVVNLVKTQLIFAAPNDRVYQGLMHAEWLGIGRFTLMPTVHDAVTFVLAGGRV